MAVVVVLPGALREYAKGAESVRGKGGNLAAVLADLEARYPGLRQRVLADTGAFREYVNVFVNGDQVEQADPAKVRVKDGDTVHILPSVAGGLE